MDVTYNGVTATSRGAIVLSVSPPARAARRISAIEVPGRDGALHIDDGTLGSVVKTVTLGMKGLTALDDIQAWLIGSGVLASTTEPGVAYHVHQAEALDWERIGRTLYQVVAIFDCEPYRYTHPAVADIVLTAPGSITNPATASAAPLLAIEGSGDITLTIGNQVLELTDLDTGIILDCAAMVAHDGAMANMSAHMQGDYPTIPPGTSAISWTGSLDKLTITPRWRYL